MNNEKKLWLLEQYAHKSWTVSLTLAQEAARAGDHGRGYAVVAHEARILANKLFEYVAGLRFDGGDDKALGGIVDFAVQMKLLSINAMLEIRQMVDISMDFNIPKSMAVFAEEIRRISVGLNELADESARQKPFTIPELAAPSTASAVECFLYCFIGGNPLIENLRNIVEVCYPSRTELEADVYSIRGVKMPVINCYRRFGLSGSGIDPDRQTVIIVNPNGANYGKEEGIYAVPIDDLDVDAIFYSKVGTNVPAKRDHAFADYARECWDAVGGGQFVLADWQKLLAR